MGVIVKIGKERLDGLWTAPNIEKIRAIQKIGEFHQDLSTPVFFLAGSRKPIQDFKQLSAG